MAIYLVTEVIVCDIERYRAYSQAGHAAVVRRGGRLLVEGGVPQSLEGTWWPRLFKER